MIIALNKLQELHPTWRHRSPDARDRAWRRDPRAPAVVPDDWHAAARRWPIPAPVMAPLRAAMEQELERIFRLLKLLFPHQDLHSAYVGVQSTNPVVHDNALEFLENILSPAAAHAAGAAARQRRARELADRARQPRPRHPVASSTEAVHSLLSSEDPVAAVLRGVRDWCAEPRRIRWPARASLYGSGPAFTGNSSTSAGEARQRVDPAIPAVTWSSP